jgi:hypothetical protein
MATIGIELCDAGLLTAAAGANGPKRPWLIVNVRQ